MAEAAAIHQGAGSNVPSTSGEEGRPSIFELVAQDSLMSGLRPAVKHLVKFLATSRPRPFRNAFRFYDELFTVVDGLLQNYYLKNYAATFSENFYGLKRSIPGSPELFLDKKTRYVSLFICVVMPYIRLKLKLLHDYLKRRHEEGHKFSNPKLEQLTRVFVRLYPLINGAIESWCLLTQVSYLVGKSRTHSPWVLLSRTVLTSLTPADYEAFYHSLPFNLGPNPNVARRLLYILHRIKSGIFHGLSKTVGFSLFFLQFLDWWFEQVDQRKVNALTALPTPPPPQSVYPEALIHKLDPGLCPICLKPRRNHTVLAISGYVFCYACIFRHLKDHAECPITHVPCSTKHLIRLFVEPA